MLEILRLTKKFGPLVAVDRISFTVPAGEVLGFLGPNGAGKSTTMKMVTGFLPPTAGTAAICGHDILARPLAAKRQLGYLPAGAPAYPDMTAAGFLRFIAHIRGLHGREARRRAAHIAELMNLADVLHHPIETLSKGDRRRVGLAQALLHDPAVLILDEPTDGLDPNRKREMWRLVRMVSREKATVIATRLPEEAEAVCSRAIIIARGRILADGAPAALAARSRYHNAVRLTFAMGRDAAIAAELADLPGVAAVAPANDDDGEGWWLFPVGGQPIIGEVAELVRARGWPVTSIRAERGRLEEVFRDITMPGSGSTEPLREAA